MIGNAKAYLDIQSTEGSFSDWLWSYVDGKPIVHRIDAFGEAPTQTELSAQIAKDLKSRGFKYCGPTIIYAFMQAVGMINDHEAHCPRWQEIRDAHTSHAPRTPST